jgi:outer membrane protein TolC
MVLAGRANADEPSIMTLEQAISTAVAQSDDLAVVRAALDRADAVKSRAISALIPNLSGQASYTLNDEEVRGGTSVIVPQHNTAGTMSVSMTLFDGRAIPGLLAAHNRLQAAIANLDDARTELRFSVADAYINVLAVEALNAVAARSVEARRAQVVAAKARLDSQAGLAMDVYRAQAALFRAQRERLNTEAQVGAMRDVLATLLGLTPPLQKKLVAPTLKHVPSPDEADAKAVALSSRRDLEGQALVVAAAEQMELATWLSFLPSVELRGNMIMGRETFVNPDGVQLQLTLQLTWLLYDGGVRCAQLKEDAALIREAQANRRMRERQIVTSVRQVLRTIRLADATVDSTQAEEQASREAVAGVTAAFKVGQATGLEVLEAQVALEQAQVEFVRARLETLRARFQLIRVLGERP